MTPTSPSVGIIGVGSMGSALLGRYLAAGVHPIAFDVTEHGRRAAADAGATVVSHPAETASADAVTVMVRTDDETLDVVLGENGVLQALAPGSLLLLHSTIHPKTTLKIAEAAGPREVDVVDAPVVGVPPVVRAGNAVALVGGTADQFARALALLQPCFRSSIHMGPTGAGNAAKIIKNLCTAAEALVLADALKIGEAWGIDYLAALSMMTAVDQYHFIDHWQTAFDESGSTSDPLKVPNLYDKDVPLAGALASSAGIAAPVTDALVAAAGRIVSAAAANGR